METVEIHELTVFTLVCRVCKKTVADRVEVRREAEAVAAAHELELHPDPEPEDA